MIRINEGVSFDSGTHCVASLNSNHTLNYSYSYKPDFQFLGITATVTVQHDTLDVFFFNAAHWTS